jgi:hypothetical protein
MFLQREHEQRFRKIVEEALETSLGINTFEGVELADLEKRSNGIDVVCRGERE